MEKLDFLQLLFSLLFLRTHNRFAKRGGGSDKVVSAAGREGRVLLYAK